jgi:hypothetical protein
MRRHRRQQQQPNHRQQQQNQPRPFLLVQAHHLGQQAWVGCRLVAGADPC